jgi:hypothetical protein
MRPFRLLFLVDIKLHRFANATRILQDDFFRHYFYLFIYFFSLSLFPLKSKIQISEAPNKIDQGTLNFLAANTSELKLL